MTSHACSNTRHPRSWHRRCSEQHTWRGAPAHWAKNKESPGTPGSSGMCLCAGLKTRAALGPNRTPGGTAGNDQGRDDVEKAGAVPEPMHCKLWAAHVAECTCVLGQKQGERWSTRQQCSGEAGCACVLGQEHRWRLGRIGAKESLAALLEMAKRGRAEAG